MSFIQSPAEAQDLQRSALRWTLTATLAAMGCAAGVAAAGGAPVLAPALVAAVLGLAAMALIHRALGLGAHPHARLGPGTALTLARGAGIAALAGLAAAPQALGPGGALGGWAVAALALAVVALDGADGWAARRAGTQSEFGARLDVETDVAFAAAAALAAWLAGTVGLWFLALPLLRPAFLAAGALWPALAAPLPPTPRRSRVAGVQYAGQVLLLVPVLTPWAGQGLGVLILSLVVWSFALDLRALTRGQAA